MQNKQTYVVAVSGGVDSVVLLHMLQTRKPENVTYIVAHFDHGIREDSAEDALFVKQIAKNSQTQFELGKGNLGKDASEAHAREARYIFLRSVREKYKTEKIITAHHQDDLLETMVLNILRGTGPRGLAPMNQDDVLRPLLNKTKQELIAYARKHKLKWREDNTNSDEKYLRNYVRKHIMPKLDPKREELLLINRKIDELYHDIDMRTLPLLPKKNVLHRNTFVSLPYIVQKELLRAWLLQNGVQDLDKKTIERLVTAAKTMQPGKQTDVGKNLWLVSQPENVLLSAK